MALFLFALKVYRFRCNAKVCETDIEFRHISTITIGVIPMKNFRSFIATLFVFALSTVVLFCSVVSAKEFPPELRVVSKSLADEFHMSSDDALKTTNEQEVRLKIQVNKFDLAKVKSNNPEIQHLADESLAAGSEMITHWDNINALPKPSKMKTFWGGFIDGFLLGSGLPPTGTSIRAIQEESAKGDAIAAEARGLIKAIAKAELAMRLLPKVTKPYCAVLANTRNDERLSVRFHSLIWNGGMYCITNNGETLTDCLLEITVSGTTGDKATFCGYIEKWDKESTLYLHGNWGIELENGEVIGQRCVAATNKVDVTLLSPKFSTSVQYLYNDVECGKTHAILFKNVKLNGSYQKNEPGIFSDWQRSFTTTLQTDITLPDCRYSVTFCKGAKRETWSRDVTEWKNGKRVKIKPGNDKLTFEPDTVEVEISFPRSDYKIKGNWNIQ
jgi:hypothetical protein